MFRFTQVVQKTDIWWDENKRSFYSQW